MFYIFTELTLKDGIVTAKAEGHPTEVIGAFREVCGLLLGGKGPWRISSVVGNCPDENILESEMEWSLTARAKRESS